MNRNLLFAAAAALVFTACSSPEEKQVVARAYDAQLTMADIQWMQADFVRDADSTEVNPELVDAWLERQAMLHEAKAHLRSREKNFDRELKEYYETLLIDAYETREVERRLDRNVPEKEIQAYYNAHREDFEIHKTIVRMNYAKFPKEYGQLGTARSLIMKGSNRSRAEQEKLEKLCYGEAENMYLESNWIVFDDILKEIPIRTSNQEQFLQQHPTVEIEDSTSVYLVCFLEYKVNEAYSPMETEKENIRQILLDERRLSLLRQLRREVVEKAYKEHEITHEISH